MGTDIHLAIEVNDGEGWRAIKFPNQYFGKYNDERKETYSLDFGRNYSAFAILGNVRNGHGFAGVDTGDGFAPLSDNRGLPEDITEEASEALSHEHSATYVTFEEMLAYDWTRRTTKRGVVSLKTFVEWDRDKDWRPWPSEYSGGISGPGIVMLTEAEMRALIQAKVSDRAALEAFIEANERTYHCKIQWEEPYTEVAGELWTKVFPLMLKLSRQHKQVRLVMDFDS